MDGPLYYLKKGDMSANQGAERLIIVANFHPKRFSLVSHAVCCVTESVPGDLWRCQNSGHAVVPNTVF